MSDIYRLTFPVTAPQKDRIMAYIDKVNNDRIKNGKPPWNNGRVLRNIVLDVAKMINASG